MVPSCNSQADTLISEEERKDRLCILGNYGLRRLEVHTFDPKFQSSGEGNGTPFQYSCLGNPMDRGAWEATVHSIERVRYDLATKPPPLSLI